MTRRTRIIWLVPCLLLLAGCIGTLPQKPSAPPEILALTEPAPRPDKTIGELETEEDETQYVVQAHVTMTKDEGKFARLREFLLGDYRPRRWWQRVFKRAPAGGE